MGDVVVSQPPQLVLILSRQSKLGPALSVSGGKMSDEDTTTGEAPFVADWKVSSNWARRPNLETAGEMDDCSMLGRRGSFLWSRGWYETVLSEGEETPTSAVERGRA